MCGNLSSHGIIDKQNVREVTMAEGRHSHFVFMKGRSQIKQTCSDGKIQYSYT